MTANGKAHHDEFDSLPLVEIDVMNKLKERLQKDPFEQKVNLVPGTYRDDKGKPYLLPSFQAATSRLQSSKKYNHEYLPLAGDSTFLDHARTLIFGSNVPAEQVASVQTAGGTGAVHLGALLLKRSRATSNSAQGGEQGSDKVLISDPTWVNHHAVFSHAGWQTGSYRYYDASTRSLDFEAMMEDTLSAPKGSIFVLHAVGHNPTGCDLSDGQWGRLAGVFANREHYAFFDCAYQGFVSGSLETDCSSIEIFARRHIPMLVCQSFSKNAGLYGERLGALHVVCQNEETAHRVREQLKVFTRTEISCPPRFGSDLVSLVCSDPELMDMWKEDMNRMAHRIKRTRHDLVSSLVELETPGDWSHLTRQQGMFGYTGLSAEQCNALVDVFHVYLPPTGRINIAALNEGNLGYVVKAIDHVVRRYV